MRERSITASETVKTDLGDAVTAAPKVVMARAAASFGG
jgi:hypothetical protein